MKQFHIWQAFPLAFFSRALYRDVAQRWRGSTFLYLLLLILVWWVPIAAMLQIESGAFAADYAPKVIDQMPVITVTNGRVAVDGTMPYVITDPETGARLAVIDTTGATPTLEAARAPALLTRDELILSEGTRGSRAYNLKDIPQLVVDRARLYDWLEIFRVWFVPLASVFVVAFMYAYRIGQALLYGLAGRIFARTLRVQLDYAALLRVAIVALTPAILLDMLLGLFGIAVPGPISLAVAIAYLYFGIKANANRDAVVAA
jgi:Protein of unknown function (DUF1189)